MEDWKTEVFPIVNVAKRSVNMRSPQKINQSVAWHGRQPNQDYFWSAQVQAGNKKTEIIRTYFNLVMVFSALGGQIYTLSSIFIFLYHSINLYKLMKNVI